MGDINYVSGQIVDAAIEVHRALGPGLLESSYLACLAHELRLRGFFVETQVPLPVFYKGVRLDVDHRLDLIVERAVIVEVKAVTKVAPVHEAQLLSYLIHSSRRLGLLINFHEARLIDGLKRIANGL